MAEMKSPDFATIQAAIAGEQWALDKVLECYGDEINRLFTIGKRQPDGSIKAGGDEDMRQQLIKKLLEAIPQFPIEEA